MQVLKLINDINIPIIDIHKVFYSHPDPLSLFPFRSQNHYNSNGYALVAKTINDYLLNE